MFVVVFLSNGGFFFQSGKIFIFKKDFFFVSHFPLAVEMKTLWILPVIILGLNLRKYAYLCTENGNQ